MIPRQYKHSYPLKETWYHFLAHISFAGSNNLLFITVLLKGCKIYRIWAISPSPLPLSYPDSGMYFLGLQNCLKSWDKVVITAVVMSLREWERAVLFLLVLLLFCSIIFLHELCLHRWNIMPAEASHASLPKYTYTPQNYLFFFLMSFRSSPVPSSKSSSTYLPSLKLTKRFQMTHYCALEDAKRKNTFHLKAEPSCQECLGFFLSITWDWDGRNDIPLILQ